MLMELTDIKERKVNDGFGGAGYDFTNLAKVSCIEEAYGAWRGE